MEINEKQCYDVNYRWYKISSNEGENRLKTRINFQANVLKTQRLLYL